MVTRQAPAAPERREHEREDAPRGRRADREKEVHMAIQWRHDFDNVFQEAKERNRPILLDFNAAPM